MIVLICTSKEYIVVFFTGIQDIADTLHTLNGDPRCMDNIGVVIF